jgi:hypothetical protein
MIFYIVLSYVIMPLTFYYAFGKTLLVAGDGITVGNVITILLWYFYGSKMVK